MLADVACVVGHISGIVAGAQVLFTHQKPDTTWKELNSNVEADEGCTDDALDRHGRV